MKNRVFTIIHSIAFWQNTGDPNRKKTGEGSRLRKKEPKPKAQRAQVALELSHPSLSNI